MKGNLFFKANLFLLFAALVLPVGLGTCKQAFPTREESRGIVKYRINLADLFSISNRAYNGFNNGNNTNSAGWLRPVDMEAYKADPESYRGAWERIPGITDWNATAADAEYYGMRLYNVDRDMNFNGKMPNPRDFSEYDGIVFKYRSNATNTEFRFQDCLFWWAFANEYDFPEWNYRGGVTNPGWIQNPGNANLDINAGPDADMYREVIIPWYRMARWGIPYPMTTPCYDSTKFNPNRVRGGRNDGRTIASGGGGTLWLEYVDFAFFKYE